MPETAVNENNSLPARQNDVGLAWNVSAMQSEAISERMQKAAHDELRRRIHGLDTSHHLGFG
jgi:hypothetical protein